MGHASRPFGGQPFAQRPLLVLAHDALAEFMHHSRKRYRDQILSSFDDGREFTYRFAEHADMEGFASQTRPADDIPGPGEPSHPGGFTR